MTTARTPLIPAAACLLPCSILLVLWTTTFGSNSGSWHQSATPSAPFGRLYQTGDGYCGNGSWQQSWQLATEKLQEDVIAGRTPERVVVSVAVAAGKRRTSPLLHQMCLCAWFAQRVMLSSPSRFLAGLTDRIHGTIRSACTHCVLHECMMCTAKPHRCAAITNPSPHLQCKLGKRS